MEKCSAHSKHSDIYILISSKWSYLTVVSNHSFQLQACFLEHRCARITTAVEFKGQLSMHAASRGHTPSLAPSCGCEAEGEASRLPRFLMDGYDQTIMNSHVDKGKNANSQWCICNRPRSLGTSILSASLPRMLSVMAWFNAAWTHSWFLACSAKK